MSVLLSHRRIVLPARLRLRSPCLVCIARREGKGWSLEKDSPMWLAASIPLSRRRATFVWCQMHASQHLYEMPSPLHLPPSCTVRTNVLIDVGEASSVRT